MFTYKHHSIQPFVRKLYVAVPLLLLGTAATAQQTGGAPAPSIWDNALALTMLIISLVLLLVIALLANVVLGTAKLHFDKQKKSSNATKIVSILVLFLAPALLQAQDAAAEAGTVAATSSIGGLTPTTFWVLAAVIATELLVIIAMGIFVKRFLSNEAVAAAKAEAKIGTSKPADFKVWWDKLNSFKPMEQEVNIDLGHNYDGIRELDNRLPPWWLYGFYVTVLIGAIYLWRYHISETAPLSKQEFEIAMKKADEEKAAYLAKAANNIDENTVAFIKEPSAIDAGKTAYVQMCAACHGKAGEGGVGPNLTDAYWIHGGSVKDIFKTIKYGWPEKGMKAWQEDFSPVQIAQISSYIKSMQGTNPPNGKEKQGDFYKDENTAPATDSSAAKKEVVINQ